MGQAERGTSCPKLPTLKWTCPLFLRLVLVAALPLSQANAQAFVQTDTVYGLFHLGEEGFLQTDPVKKSYHYKSLPPPRGSCRPIRFQPSMLDFHEQPVGMPKLEKVYLHNPSTEDEITLLSISAATADFHASFFQDRIIQPGGNTSFDVVFLARVVGNVENTLFINTSHHGVFTYQVFGVGVPNPYRLRPFIGARVPINSSFSPLISIHNPHSEPLQVVEMYSSGGDLHLELPTGQQTAIRQIWAIPPFETKAVMRASFSSHEADNHTAFIRIKTNASDSDRYIVLPVEVEVTAAPGIYASTEMLDFGTLRSQDKAKLLNLHLLNSGSKDVQILSIRASPSNEAVAVNFKVITLKAGGKYTKVASITFDASKAHKASQSSGKITVKTKEKSYTKLEIPYQAEVLEGYLGFDHSITLFHIRDSAAEPLVKPVHLTNTFRFPVLIHQVALPEDAASMFKVANFSQPVLIAPQASLYVFSLEFRPQGGPSRHIHSNILLGTNASHFHLPVRAYSGLVQPLVLPPSLSKHFLDFGVLGVGDSSAALVAVLNSNPVEVVLRAWHVTGDSVTVDLLKTERGNRSTVVAMAGELEKNPASLHKMVILASGYFAVFRVSLSASPLEGPCSGAVHITTDYEILMLPVKAMVAVGTLSSHPKQILLPPAFPGRVVHHSLTVLSTFTQPLRLQQVQTLTDDRRFFLRRLKSSQQLEPHGRTKVAKVFFDPRLQCGDLCYVGVPFLLHSEVRPPGLVMQEDRWAPDLDLYLLLRSRWKTLRETSMHRAEAVFQAHTDLHQEVRMRVSAQLTWPTILSSPRHLSFPLTAINGFSEVQVHLENPADSPVWVQVVPMAMYPDPSSLRDRLKHVIPLDGLPDFSPTTLEFYVYTNQSSWVRSSRGFSEGHSQPHVYNLALNPEDSRTLRVTFTPAAEGTVSTLLMLRNNLTGLEFLLVQGQGCEERLRVGGRHPGPAGFLRIKMLEAHLKECTQKEKPREPNLTLRKTFTVENTGLLPIHIQAIEVGGRSCEGYSFKVLNCQEFMLDPNTSRDIIILFTPDFTASRVVQELRLTSALGSRFSFQLNASLPFHLLGPCASSLPRPPWELELYLLVSLTMSTMFLLVVVVAYLEALGIWDVFTGRLQASSGPAVEPATPFDLQEGGRPQPGSPQASSRRAPGGQSGRPPPPPPPSLPPAPKPSDSPTASGQQAGRKARAPAGPKPLPAAPVTRGEWRGPVEVMEQELERLELPCEELETPGTQSKGVNVKQQRRPKLPHHKREDGERRPMSEPQAEEEICSSTTTNAEVSFKEDSAVKKGRHPSLEKNQEAVTDAGVKRSKRTSSQSPSSLELPYVTRVENRRMAFCSKNTANQTSSSAAHTRVVPSSPRVCRGKQEELGPSPLAQRLGWGRGGGSSGSSSEGENSSSPLPEWDTIAPYRTSAMDSLEKISTQTLNADPFLRRPSGSPPPPPPPPGFSYSDSAPSRPHPATAPSLAASLPGQNWNPTFAAVAAGYDKSPGGSSSGRGASGWSGGVRVPTMNSEGSLSAGLVSPIGIGRNTFSAFGTDNLFNWSGVFSSSHPAERSSWPESSPPSSPSSSCSSPQDPWAPIPATPATGLLDSRLWSSSAPFSPSIWSFDPSPLALLMDPSPALSPAHNPWNTWRPAPGRRSSEPWPRHSEARPRPSGPGSD